MLHSSNKTNEIITISPGRRLSLEKTLSQCSLNSKHAEVQKRPPGSYSGRCALEQCRESNHMISNECNPIASRRASSTARQKFDPARWPRSADCHSTARCAALHLAKRAVSTTLPTARNTHRGTCPRPGKRSREWRGVGRVSRKQRRRTRRAMKLPVL